MPEVQPDPKKLRAVDAWYWAYYNKISLGGKPYKLEGHEYQVDPLQCDAPRQCSKKGAQMGWTEIGVISVLHGLRYGRYPTGSLYLFPTRDDVIDFSKGRFQPLITENAFISRHVRDTDAANIKRIGPGLLYLRGARASKRIEGIKATASQLKSVPVDRIDFDEVDEMSSDMVQLALERISHSEIQEERYLSTPSIPDFGIDKLYNKSDQRVWMITCGGCGKETCLEMEFPECLKERKSGVVFRACKHCGKEIHPRDGQWVAQYPEREKDLVGWWISQLNSIYVNPKKILDLYNDPPNGNISEVYNSKLGMAYIEAENRLTKNEIYARCGRDPMPPYHSGPSAMGVDVGKVLHVAIGVVPFTGGVRIVKLARVSSFNDVHDLAKKFNVKMCVIDLYPETRKVREFREAEKGSFGVFGCDYQEHQKGQAAWDKNNGVVTVNRTEICDATHDLVVQTGRLELPRRSKEVDVYAIEMCNIAKALEENELTGKKTYRYRKLGADHYRHATNYLSLATQHIHSFVRGSSGARKVVPAKYAW